MNYLEINILTGIVTEMRDWGGGGCLGTALRIYLRFWRETYVIQRSVSLSVRFAHFIF